MKTIGLIGRLSWESSAEYYRIINQRVQTRLGGLHSAKCIMTSFDFAEIEALQRGGRWDEATQMMVAAAQSLKAGGADFLVITANTMHRMADAVQQAADIPLLHIADATAERIVAQGFRTVGLLGTIYTMEQDFYKGRLTQKYGLTVHVPEAADRQTANRIIYDELCRGIMTDDSRAEYRRIIAELVAAGAECVILGCTELLLLVQEADSTVPLFDTTTIHAEAAVQWALKS